MVATCDPVLIFANYTKMSTEFKQISETNLKKVSNSISKIGYIDGITAGEDSVFQSGFDQGYADGLRTGFEIAKWRTLIMNKSTDKNTKCVDIEEIPPPTNKSHFQMPQNKDKTITEISKLQNDYIDNLINKLEVNYPNVSNMLYCKE